MSGGLPRPLPWWMHLPFPRRSFESDGEYETRWFVWSEKVKGRESEPEDAKEIRRAE